MQISKAIEKLSDISQGLYTMSDPDTKDAVKMGLGALHLIQQLRNSNVPAFMHPLPGETKIQSLMPFNIFEP